MLTDSTGFLGIKPLKDGPRVGGLKGHQSAADRKALLICNELSHYRRARKFLSLTGPLLAFEPGV